MEKKIDKNQLKKLQDASTDIKKQNITNRKKKTKR